MHGKELEDYREQVRIKNLTIDTEETNTSLVPLYQALKDKDTKEVKKIITSGIPVNVKMIGERTPLHFSAYENDRATSEYLLEAGANMEDEDIHKKTPLYYGIENDAVKTASLLLDKNAKIPKLIGFTGKNMRLKRTGAPVLFYAACTEMFDMTELLLKEETVDKNQIFGGRNVYAYINLCINEKNRTKTEKQVYTQKVENIRGFLNKYGFESYYERQGIQYDEEVR